MKVVSNTAVSLDGRIATTDFDHVRLGTRDDLRRMSELRAQADAVLVGGRSFRNYPQPLVEQAGDRVPRSRPIVTAVLTRRGIADLSLDPLAWKKAGAELVVFGPHSLDRAAHEALGATVVTSDVSHPGWVLDALGDRGSENVLVEGGGDLLFQLLELGRLDELYVTLCPWLIGGVGAPSLCDGKGFSPDTMRALHLLDMRQNGGELFLHYTVAGTRTDGASQRKRGSDGAV
jgi:riboflavin-specific deaminase-like protein